MSLSITARRLVFPEVNRVEIETFEIPSQPDPGQLLVKTRTTLISTGTETALLQGRSPAVRSGRRGFPIYPGYSYTGEVMAVGADVDNFRVGDVVFCQAPHASHVAISASTPTVIKVPCGVTMQQAPFTTLYAVALYAIRRAAIAFGESVVIVGAGLVGQLALRLARQTGAHPLAIGDLRDERLRPVRAHGTELAAVLDTDGIAELKAATYESEGFDVVIDATGSPNALPTSLELARRRGRVILLGSPHGPVQLEDLFMQIARKDITLIGAHQPNNPQTAILTYPWSQRRDRELILELLQKGKLDINGIPYLTVTPDEAPAVYTRFGSQQEQALTALIDWTQ